MSVLSKVTKKKRVKKAKYNRGFLNSQKIYPEGRYGLELEVEGRNTSMMQLPDGWVRHNDGSLRGESSEYVSYTPLDFDKSLESLRLLFDEVKKQGTTLNDSNRTSFHVHMNTKGLNLVEVANIIAMYSICERLLLNFCGPHRVGNCFARSLKDSTGIMDRLAEAFNTNSFRRFPEDYRYAALNVASINKFGSLEFRGMRGITTYTEGEQWLQLINCLYEQRNLFDSPRQMVEMFSGEELNFVRKVFGNAKAETLFAHTHAVGESPLQALYGGARLFQEIAYLVDWDEMKKDMKIPYVPSPFKEDNPERTNPVTEEIMLRAARRATATRLVHPAAFIRP